MVRIPGPSWIEYRWILKTKPLNIRPILLRQPILRKPENYAAFLRVLKEAVAQTETGWLAYRLLLNHGHLVVWPLQRPANRVEQVNSPPTEAELAVVRHSVACGCPFGEPTWSDPIVRRLPLESTLRTQSRPKKQRNGS